jgi:hypothetical protein
MIDKFTTAIILTASVTFFAGANGQMQSSRPVVLEPYEATLQLVQFMGDFEKNGRSPN